MACFLTRRAWAAKVNTAPISAAVASATSPRPWAFTGVMVMGGHDGSAERAECYVGTVSGGSITWVASTSLPAVRYGHAAVVLADGRVMVIGGNQGGVALDNCYVGTVSGSSVTWVVNPSLPGPRRYHSAVTLADGRVMVMGGHDGAGVKAECYLGNLSGVSVIWVAYTSLPSPSLNNA